ncbi:MAG: TMEM175 family protein [Roseiflexaceae bacterium]|nr:TMEM175 family protein [Roseiflexaceae bacterium]
MPTSKNRLEALSDGMFAIILTILVLELHVPHLVDASMAAFLVGMAEIVPKLVSFLFSFFICFRSLK